MARTGVCVWILMTGLTLLACEKDAGSRRPAAAPSAQGQSGREPAGEPSDDKAEDETQADEPLVPPPDDGGYAPIE